MTVSDEQWRYSAIHSPPNSPLTHVTLSRFYVLSSRALLVIHLKNSSVYMPISLSTFKYDKLKIQRTLHAFYVNFKKILQFIQHTGRRVIMMTIITSIFRERIPVLFTSCLEKLNLALVDKESHGTSQGKQSQWCNNWGKKVKDRDHWESFLDPGLLEIGLKLQQLCNSKTDSHTFDRGP